MAYLDRVMFLIKQLNSHELSGNIHHDPFEAIPLIYRARWLQFAHQTAWGSWSAAEQQFTKS